DHAVHLPFLLRTLDPSYLVGDPAVDALAHHPTLFWDLQAPLTSWISIEDLYVVIHIASLAALYAGARSLGRALFPGNQGSWAAAITPALVVIGHLTLAGIVSMDAQVLNRTVSLGPLLYALTLGARGAHLRGFAVAGLTFWIHPTTALHGVVLLWCGVWVPRAAHRRIRAAILGPLVFLIAASPLIVKMASHRSTSGVPFPGPPEWWEFVHLNMYFHIYPFDMPWIVGPFVLLYGLVFFAVGRRFVPSAARAYLIGIGVCCAAGFVGTGLFRIPQAVFLHLWESIRFLVFIAAACCAAWVASSWHGAWNRRARVASALFALAFAMDLPFLVAWWQYSPWVHHGFAVTSLVVCCALAYVARNASTAPPPRPPPWWLGSGLVAAVALLHLVVGPSDARPALTSLHPGVIQPRFLDAPEDVALESWCRVHLPADALVVLPLEWSTLIHFRYGARRAVFVTLKDGPESVFSLDHNQEYRRRVEAVCDCKPFALARYGDHAGRDRLFMEFDVIKQGVQRMTGDRARRLFREFGVTHIVAAASQPLVDLGEIVYRDRQYVVVRITP
ncbi:MAG TPA: hypothetical protein VHN14_18930, partial [Kofleriaceae bacterium]|nr:hypothetical protein [Kofleriaceae bacterium]